MLNSPAVSLMGEGSQLLILSFLFAPLSPLVGERGWGIEGEGKKPPLVRGGNGGLAPQYLRKS